METGGGNETIHQNVAIETFVVERLINRIR